MSKEISVLLFDLDGTLHDRQSTVTKIARSQHSRFPEFAGVSAQHFLERFQDFDRRGYVSRDLLYDAISRQFGLSSEVKATLQSDFYENYSRFTTGFEGLHEMLSASRDMGYRLAVVTNGSPMQAAKIENLGIAEFFEEVTISDVVGLKKPDPRIFHHTLQKLNAPPEQAIFVGDHPQFDVAAAQAVGMKGIWFEDRYWEDCPYADATIQSLPELIPALSSFK